MSSYGIPSTLLPISPENNSVDMRPHLRWCQNYISNDGRCIRNRNQLLKLPSPSGGSTVTEPNPNDVLSVGSRKIDNAGNERLRVLVKESLEAYRSGSNDEKRHIVDRIISELHGAGGRFLRQEKGSQTWTELSLSKVRLKMTQRFRNHIRRRESVSQQVSEGNLITDTPRSNDVILGRAQQSQGTAYLHRLIKEESEEYAAVDRGLKVVVVDGIMERIKNKGGRFLQPSTSDIGGYVELSADSIRDRIPIYFRNHRRSSKNMAATAGL